MAYNTEAQRGGTCPSDLTIVHKEKAGGTISAHRLVTIATDGDVEQATAGATNVIGVLHSNYNGKLDAVAGDLVSVGVSRQTAVADVALVAGQSLKAAAGGRVIQFVDDQLSGDTIEDNVGLGFTNQPANDGVEVVSSDNADTTQTVTIYYTRNGGGDTVSTETKTLNGTTQVAFTHTDIQLVLAVEKSAATAGTVTFREASANQTIATLAAGTLSSGKIAVTAGQTLAYNVAPTAVADAATTKQVGLIGTDSSAAVQYDSQALTGATTVTFNSAFRTVTYILTGDLEAARTVTVKVGAEDNQKLYVGFAREAASAQGDLVDIEIDPQHTSAGDVAFLDGVTAGEVVASKAVVVDASKNIGDFGNLDAVNFDAGASGTAGTVDVFPATASKGKVALTAADSAGDTTTTIVNASQAGARTYTIPDAGASASFVMTEGAQTVNGAKTIPDINVGASGTVGAFDIFPATASKGKINILAADSAGDTTTTITNRSQAGARTFTVPDPGASADFLMLPGGTQSFIGAATSVAKLMGKKTGIADASATDILTITVPNANHAASIKVSLLSSNGAGDAFESSRCAEGLVVVARTTGANAVAAAAALAVAQIATVAAGATHTLAYGVSAIAGAVGDPNTFTIQVTIDDSGNVGGNQLVWIAELINAEASGVTMAAA